MAIKFYGGYMNFKKTLLWTSLAMTVVTMIACGSKKDESQKGRPTAPAGGSSAPTGPAGSTGTGTVSNKSFQMTVSNINREVYIDEQGESSQISFQVRMANGSTINLFNGITNQTQASEIGDAKYFIHGENVITYSAKCDTTKCDTVYLVFWVGNSTNGINEFQMGIMKDMNGSIINTAEQSDQYSYQIRSVNNKLDYLSLDSMISYLNASVMPVY